MFSISAEPQTYLLGTIECRIGLESHDPRNILCVKNCTNSDPVHGESVIAFGEKMNLLTAPGYQWTDFQVKNRNLHTDED